VRHLGGTVFSAKALVCVRPAESIGRSTKRAKTRKSCRLFGRIIMKAISNFVTGLIRDEQGGEVLEYALIAGLIVVAAIAVIGSVGGKVLARWNSLNSSM
jgi:pilus assembly protein Flp/PilA